MELTKYIEFFFLNDSQKKEESVSELVIINILFSKAGNFKLCEDIVLNLCEDIVGLVYYPRQPAESSLVA